MAFITDATLKTSVAAALKKAAADLASYWDTIIADANAAAYNEIVSKLAGRGYTLAQILAWDRGVEFEKKLGICWALRHGGGLDGYDDKFIEKFCAAAEELEEVLVTTDSVVVEPTGTVGTVGTGPLDTTEDVFVPFDPNDSRKGQVTEW